MKDGAIALTTNKTLAFVTKARLQGMPGVTAVIQHFFLVCTERNLYHS